MGSLTPGICDHCGSAMPERYAVGLGATAARRFCSERCGRRFHRLAYKKDPEKRLQRRLKARYSKTRALARARLAGTDRKTVNREAINSYMVR